MASGRVWKAQATVARELQVEFLTISYMLMFCIHRFKSTRVNIPVLWNHDVSSKVAALRSTTPMNAYLLEKLMSPKHARRLKE